MLLELQNLGKSFGEHEVLKDVNAGVAARACPMQAMLPLAPV